MPNSKSSAIEYLKSNKNKFPLEVLRQKLREAGYPKEVIDEAIVEVFQVGVGSAVRSSVLKAGSFWNFKSQRTYISFGEKLSDFLFGWLGMWVFYWITVSSIFYAVSERWYNVLPLMILFAIHIFAIFYFWKRRHYLARGLLFGILLLLILYGFISVTFGGFLVTFGGSGRHIF